MSICMFQSLLLCALLTCGAGRVAQISYVGCYQDGDNSNRDLTALKGVSRLGLYTIDANIGIINNGDMSLEFCSDVCSLGGFPYFGVQFSEQCFCGTSYGLHGKLDDSKCDMQCAGNSLQTCGGFGTSSIFSLAYPKNNFYKMLKNSTLTVETSKTSFWPAATPSVMHCLAKCSARADCQAAVFSKRLLACHLLAFAYPPASLTGPDWTLYQRG
uniref:WSC domain-containing protein n=1 Tax=Macrostomum lignano TaxID=282301 RepID=A0A1I8FU86_9PLAT